MKNEKIVKVSTSVALAAVLFTGCGNSTDSITHKAAELSQNTNTVQKNETIKSEVSKSLNALTGKIRTDSTPTDGRTTHTLSKDIYSVTAYNLDDNSVYKTTTDASGVYNLSGLSDGEYQIYAQNDKIAKSDIQRVTLARGTKKVVDFVLQAAGSIKGRIKGADVVFIPGKDFISIADKDGNFELTNIPVGTYTLGYEGKDADGFDIKGVIEVSVAQGMTDLALIQPKIELFNIKNSTLPLGVLELHHKGISFEIKGKVDLEKLKNAVSLKDSSGKKIKTKLYFENYGYDDRGEDRYYQRGGILSEDIVPAGTYTLTIASSVSDKLDADIVKIFQINAVSVATVENSGGVRYINIYTPKDLNDTQKATFGTPVVKEKGSTKALSVKPVWTKENQLTLFGSYKTGVEYVIELSDAQKAIIGEVKTPNKRLAFDQTKIEDIYPQSGSDEVSLHEKLYANFTNIGELDPSSVKITLSDGAVTKIFEKQDIGFSVNRLSDMTPSPYGQDISEVKPSPFYDETYGSVFVANAKLEYAKNYTMKVEAKDIFGNSLIKETSFSTLTPSLRSLSPENLDELFRGDLRAEFNVAVKQDGAEITVEDLSDPASSVKVVMRDEKNYYDDHAIAFEFEGLKPQHKYKVTAKGFKSIDGAQIAPKSTEFSTPPRMMFIDNRYMQNLFVTPQNFEHKVKFFIFGGLSDSEKEFLKTHLRVTSYANVKTPDATHPPRKLFFLNKSDGVEVVVAFTIDPNTNYEISFDDISGLSGIVMPRGFEAGKPLVSFSTIMQTNQDFPTDMTLIRDMNLYSDGSKASVGLDVAIPLGRIAAYESCWNEFEERQNDMTQKMPNYIKVEDAQNKKIEVKIDPNFKWNLESRYIDNDTQMCMLRPEGYWDEQERVYKSGFNAYFDVDFASTYTVTVDFSGDFSDSGFGALKLSKQLKTAPLGKLDFWVDDNGGQDAILFHIHSNAPIVNPEILKVTMDAKEYRATDFSFNANQPDIPDYGMKDGVDLVFELPRQLYSLVQFSLSKDDGSVLKFFNPNTESEVAKPEILATAKIFTQSVSPDFIPVKVESVHTLSPQNRFVVVEFNRMMNMSDIVSYTDANKTEISDIAFEIKDDQGNPVAVTAVESDYNNVVFELANELNVSKTYTISLKSGKSLQSAFGVQKLSNFSRVIQPTVIEIPQAAFGRVDYSFDSSQPYQMGSTQEMQAKYVNINYLAIELNMADGVKIDINDSSINVYNKFDGSINEGSFSVEGGKIIQPVKDAYYDAKVDVSLSYLFNGKSREYKRVFDYIPQMPKTADLYSIVGNGVNSLVFNFSMDQAPISEKNFKIYDQNGLPVEGATLSVQVDPNNFTSAIVTFGALANDTLYRIDVVGLSAYGDNISSDTLVSQVFIKTAAN